MPIIKNLLKGLLVAFLLTLLFIGVLTFLVNLFLPEATTSIFPTTSGTIVLGILIGGLITIWVGSLGRFLYWGIKEYRFSSKPPAIVLGKKFFYLTSTITLLAFLVYYLNLNLNYIFKI